MATLDPLRSSALVFQINKHPVFNPIWARTVAHCTALHMNQPHAIPWLILGLHAANQRRRYKVTPSLIGWAQT